MDMKIPPLSINIVLGSSPLKSIKLVGEPGVIPSKNNNITVLTTIATVQCGNMIIMRSCGRSESYCIISMYALLLLLLLLLSVVVVVVVVVVA